MVVEVDVCSWTWRGSADKRVYTHALLDVFIHLFRFGLNGWSGGVKSVNNCSVYLPFYVLNREIQKRMACFSFPSAGRCGRLTRLRGEVVRTQCL